jgi:hypothetical protein
LLGDVSLTHSGRNLPRVSPSVLHHATTVAVWRVEWCFYRKCPRGYRALPCRISILYVYIKAGEHLLPDAGVTNHDYGIANFEFRGTLRAVISSRIEYLSNKLNQTSGVRNDYPWSNEVPTIGFEVGGTG